MKPAIPTDAILLVCDARKALLLANKGDEVFPNFQILRVTEAPPTGLTHALGTDNPGRVSMGVHRSAIEGNDLHRQAEDAFATSVARDLEQLHQAQPIKTLILAAPPRMLAVLRNALSEPLRRHVVVEINREFTKLPVYEIEQHVLDAQNKAQVAQSTP
jgi:protein required for attachment to host cells